MELSLRGGAACLDFVNTIDPRFGPDAHDVLGSYDELVAWARHAGVLAARAPRPRGGPAALRSALDLRDVLDRVFRAVARGKRPRGNDLAYVRHAYAEGVRGARLVAVDGAFTFRPDADPILWPVLESALELLRSPALARVKECANVEECGWLFLDASKNASRRWCSMASCGTRAKVRRYRTRKRATVAA